MAKKTGIRKIETNIPYDTFISSIDGIIGTVKRATLNVYFTSKKIYELDNNMFVVFDIYDNTGEMKALLIGDRDKEFISLVDSIKVNDNFVEYKISGDISIPVDIDNLGIPFIKDIKNNKVFCIYAIQKNLKPKYLELKHLAKLEIKKVRDGISIVQQSIINGLKLDDKSISMKELHVMYCFNGDDGFDLNIHQFYNLYVYPLIKNKEIKVCNLNQCTKDKVLPMIEYELIYNK